MKKATLTDLQDLSAILEEFAGGIEKMPEPDLIDLAARLKPAAKHIEAIDKYVKERVKERLHHKEGQRNGNIFRAILKLVPTTRFQQKVFQEAHPKIFESFTRGDTDERVSFETR